MRKKIAGLVIWYNPTNDHIQNINSYIEFIDELYILDNSSSNNEKKILFLIEEKRKKIIYIPFYENKGVSFALNYGAKLAIERDKNWILTMDQDSYFKKNTIQNYLKGDLLEDKEVGIYAPKYIYSDEKDDEEDIKVETEYVITSGNLVNLKIFNEIGGFEEQFFIDEIDHEYCLRLRLNKKKIYTVNNVILYHSLGEIKIKKIFLKKIYYTQHNSFRKYNIWKNKMYMIKKYPFLKMNYIKFFIKDLFKVLLVEDEKMKKLKIIKRVFMERKCKRKY